MEKKIQRLANQAKESYALPLNSICNLTLKQSKLGFYLPQDMRMLKHVLLNCWLRLKSCQRIPTTSYNFSTLSILTPRPTIQIITLWVPITITSHHTNLEVSTQYLIVTNPLQHPQNQLHPLCSSVDIIHTTTY